METKIAQPERRSARERLLAAAEELFYEEGVNTVGIERIIERAGVAKASLYSTFGSKDELIRAYLVKRHTARKTRIEERLALCASPRERLLAVFDVMGELIAEPNFRGCAFLRASAEARSNSSVRGVCDDARKWLRTLLRDLAEESGAVDPEQLAQQLVLLYDGVSVSAQMDRNLSAAAAARAAAEKMMEAQTNSPSVRH